MVQHRTLKSSTKSLSNDLSSKSGTAITNSGAEEDAMEFTTKNILKQNDDSSKTTEVSQREQMVNQMRTWLNQEENGMDPHSEIVDVYNNQEGGLPVGYALKDNDAWCAATVSAAAEKSGNAGAFPSECSVNRMVESAKENNQYVSSDVSAHTPAVGDLCIYDWNGDGSNDHVGLVSEVGDNGQISVIEGNKDNAMGLREVQLDNDSIAGYICPQYSDETKDDVMQKHLQKSDEASTEKADEKSASEYAANTTTDAEKSNGRSAIPSPSERFAELQERLSKGNTEFMQEKQSLANAVPSLGSSRFGN